MKKIQVALAIAVSLPLLISSRANAQSLLPTVYGATINTTTSTVTLTGANFGQSPTVTLGGVLPLTVNPGSTSTQIVADFPAALAPGSYLLYIQFADSSTALFEATFGAVGPSGPAGPTGPVGPVGPAGPAGPASSITAVSAGTDLIGGGTTGNVTLNLNVAATDARYAQLNAANTFTGNQTVSGNLSSYGSITSSYSLNVVRSGRCPYYLGMPCYAFSVDSSGNLGATNANLAGNVTVSGTLRSDNGGLSLGGYAPVSVDAPGKPGGRLAILSTGQVGINNPSPQVDLDVNGYTHSTVLAGDYVAIGGDPQMHSNPRMTFSGFRPGTLCVDRSCNWDGPYCNPVASVGACIAGFFTPDRNIQITRITVSLANRIDPSCARELYITQPGSPYVLLYGYTLPTDYFGDSGPIAVNVSGGEQIALSTAVGPCNVGSSGGSDLFVNVQYVMR